MPLNIFWNMKKNLNWKILFSNSKKKILLFWQIIIEEFVNLKNVLQTLIKLNYCVNTNNIFQSQKWFQAKSRKLSCKSQKSSTWCWCQQSASIRWQCTFCLLQGNLWRPTIFCFKSNEKFPDKSLSTALTAHQNGTFFVFFIGEVIVIILDL